MGKRYLVTGAAGFIGSAIAKKLINDNNDVWTIDNLTTGFLNNLPNEINFIEGNCQDDKSIKKLMNTKFDAIIHFAGQSSGEISFDDPVFDLRTNCESTLKLIQYGLSTGCNRFIYASSMSVYGDVPDNPISETNPCSPLSFYGVGKLASEHYLRIYQTKGLQPTSLRIFNVYGPGQNLSNLRQGMVSIYLAQMLSDHKIIVKGSSNRFRDFIYIDDVVQLTMLILSSEISIGKVYNIGTGVKTTVQDVLNKLIKIYGKEIKVQFTDPTPGDQLGIIADIQLLNTNLKFNNLTDFDSGLKQMVNWAENIIV
jgi:UDP-glucose 4-epimerase